MTTSNNFLPAADPMVLSARFKAALAAASDLMETMGEDLPDAKQAALLRLVDGGGRVGIEMTVDRSGSTRVSLIGVEREGARLTLATVVTVGSGAKQ